MSTNPSGVQEPLKTRLDLMRRPVRAVMDSASGLGRERTILLPGGFWTLKPVEPAVIDELLGLFQVAGRSVTYKDLSSFVDRAREKGIAWEIIDCFLFNSKQYFDSEMFEEVRTNYPLLGFGQALWSRERRFPKRVLKEVGGPFSGDYVSRVLSALVSIPLNGTSRADVVRAILRGNPTAEGMIFRAFEYLSESEATFLWDFDDLETTHPALASKIAAHLRKDGFRILTRPFVVVDQNGVREVSLPTEWSVPTLEHLEAKGNRELTIHDVAEVLDKAGDLRENAALFFLRHTPNVTQLWKDLGVLYPDMEVFKTLPYVGGYHSHAWTSFLLKHDSLQQRAIVERVVGIGVLDKRQVQALAEQVMVENAEYGAWLDRLTAKAISDVVRPLDILTQDGVVRPVALNGDVDHYYRGLFANNRDQGGDKSRATPFLRAVGVVDNRVDIFLSRMRAEGFVFTDLEAVAREYPQLKMFNSFVRGIRPLDKAESDFLWRFSDRDHRFFSVIKVLWTSDDLARDLPPLVAMTDPLDLFAILRDFIDNNYLDLPQLRKAVEQGAFDESTSLKRDIVAYLGEDDSDPEFDMVDVDDALQHPQWHLSTGGLFQPRKMDLGDVDDLADETIPAVDKIRAYAYALLRTEPSYERKATIDQVQRAGVLKGHFYDAPHCSHTAYKVARQGFRHGQGNQRMIRHRDLIHALARWLCHSVDLEVLIALAVSDIPEMERGQFLTVLTEAIEDLHTWGQIDHNQLAASVVGFQTSDNCKDLRGTAVGAMFNELELYLQERSKMTVEDGMARWFRGWMEKDIRFAIRSFENGTTVTEEMGKKVLDLLGISEKKEAKSPPVYDALSNQIMLEEDERILDELRRIAPGLDTEKATDREPPKETGPDILGVIKDDITTSALRVGVKHTRTAVTGLVTSFVNRITVERLEGESDEDYNLRAEGMRSGVTGFLLGDAGQSVISYMVGLSWAVAGDPESSIAKYADPIAQEMRAQGGSELLDGFLESVVFPFVNHMTERATKQPRVRVAHVPEATTETVKETEALPVHIQEMDRKAIN